MFLLKSPYLLEIHIEVCMIKCLMSRFALKWPIKNKCVIGMQTSPTTMENNMQVPQKLK